MDDGGDGNNNDGTLTSTDITGLDMAGSIHYDGFTAGLNVVLGRADDLSAREVEVLQLVAEGQSNKDIGVALGLSALTVKSHLARISRKLGTGDRAEMVAISMRTGYVH